jgi:hypothetical protein
VFPDAGHPQPRKDIDAFPQQAIPEYRFLYEAIRPSIQLTATSARSIVDIEFART